MPRTFGMMLTASSQSPPSEIMCAVATVPFNVMFVVVGTYMDSEETLKVSWLLLSSLLRTPPVLVYIKKHCQNCQASSPAHRCDSVRKLVHAVVIKVSCMGASPVWAQISHQKPTGPGLMVLAFIVCSCRTKLKSAGAKGPSMRSRQLDIGKLEGALA